jgi:large subunit ribosomal protein L29
MQAKDIRELTEQDIHAKIADLERERFNLRVRSGTQTLDDPLRIRVIRKEIARLQTVLTEKIIGIDEAKKPSAPASRRVTGRRGRKRATASTRSKKRV